MMASDETTTTTIMTGEVPESPDSLNISFCSTLSSKDNTCDSFVREDHSKKLLLNIREMVSKNILTDVTLKTEAGYKIKCHRLILSANCEYFNVMFTGQLRESRQKEITIHNIDDTTLSSIVDYCYSGSVDIFDESVETLLSAACLLQLPDVITACTSFLTKKLHPSNCIGIYRFADMHSCDELKASAESFIADHFNEVTKSKEFMSLPYAHLVKLLSCEELNIESEVDAYVVVMKWMKKDLENRAEKMFDLLSVIKLPLLPESFLVDTVSNDVEKHGNSHCRNLLMEALTYYLLPERRLQLQCFRTRPRPSTLDNIYILGGADPSNREAMSVEVFEPRSSTWSDIGHTRDRRLQFGTGIMEGMIYVAGGRDGLKTLNRFECLFKHYKTRNSTTYKNVWIPKTSMLTFRHGLGVSVLEQSGPLYAIGGHDGWSYLNTVERWDPKLSQWNFVAPMLSPRSTAGVAALNSKIYAVGGRDGSSCLRTAEMYDPLTNAWYTIASMGKRRASIGLAAIGGCLYAVGGHEGSMRFDSVEKYDPRENIWHVVASMNIGRDAVAVAALGDRLIAIGGYDGQNYLSLTEIYDPYNNTWTHLSSLNVGRAGACAVPVSRTDNNMFCKSSVDEWDGDLESSGSFETEARDG